MKVEKILGKMPENTEKEVDTVSIDWYNSHKKIQRLTSKNGRDVGISLEEHSAEHGLKQGDLLWEEEGFLLTVDILPCEVLVISAENTALIPKICYEIGNRHAPFFYADNHIDFITPYDKPIQVMLEKIGAKVSVKTMKINLNHNISSSHGGGHSHGEGGHSHGGHGHSHGDHGHSHGGHHAISEEEKSVIFADNSFSNNYLDNNLEQASWEAHGPGGGRGGHRPGRGGPPGPGRGPIHRPHHAPPPPPPRPRGILPLGGLLRPLISPGGGRPFGTGTPGPGHGPSRNGPGSGFGNGNSGGGSRGFKSNDCGLH